MRVSIEAYFLINLLMDTAILSIVARSCGTFRARRIIAAGILCALYALLAVWHPRPWATPLVQLGLLIPVSMLVSGKTDVRLCATAGFLLICGMMLAGGAERLALTSNRVLESLATVAGLGILGILLSYRKRMRSTWQVEVGMSLHGRTAQFQALIDTGNRLHEPISGLPVLIVEEYLLAEILPESGYRLVAYGALGGSGTLECFHPDDLWVTTSKRRRPAPDAWVAIFPGQLPGSAHALAPGVFATIPQD